jgi:hypothetical protein
MVFASTESRLGDALKACKIDYKVNEIIDLRGFEIMKVTEDLQEQSKVIEGLKKQLAPKWFVKQQRLPGLIKKQKLVGWECKVCKKVFLKPVFVKQHLIDKHEITDLRIIESKIQHTTDKKAKVVFS